MTARRRGFTLIEMLAALAVAALIAVGLVQLILGSMQDSKNQQAAQHQQRVAAAAGKYLAANQAALAAIATATVPARVTVAELQAAGFLSAQQQPANAYGQTPCLLVLQPSAGKLEALVVTEGAPIPAKELPAVAANAGPGGGYIANETPLVAQGAYGSWHVANAEMSRYLSANCGGTAAAGGSLATALFFDSNAEGDFLYRAAVPGHPELNRMTAPLHMAAVAVDGDAADTRCVAADPSTHGRIAVDAAARVLSCQAGVWKSTGSGSWKDPVANHADLPPAGNAVGDVRMVTSLSRAFTWNGAGWEALAVDENGNLQVPGTVIGNHLQVNQTETVETACSPNGLIAKDSTGMLLSCQSGRWRKQASAELAHTETGEVVIMKSDFKTYPTGTQFYAGPLTYYAPIDTMMSIVERDVMPVKDGLIIANVSADMHRGQITNTTESAQFTLYLTVINIDNGAVIAHSKAMSPTFVNDEASLTATLSKAVPKNVNGYRFQMMVYWTTFTNSYAGNIYNHTNYLNAFGAVVERTPLEMNWSLDVTY